MYRQDEVTVHFPLSLLGPQEPDGFTCVDVNFSQCRMIRAADHAVFVAKHIPAEDSVLPWGLFGGFGVYVKLIARTDTLDAAKRVAASYVFPS